MRSLGIIGSLLAAVLLAAPALATPSGLDAWRWRKRVVLVFAPAPDDPRLAAERRALATLTQAADDRDLVAVEIVGDRATPPGVHAVDLRKRLHVGPAAFRVLLIGKDGGVKLDERTIVGPDRLAALIDAMPMRQDEMAARRR
jgi:hypothetical protein